MSATIASTPGVELPTRRGSDRLRIALIGCGDVATRRYLPALADLRAHVEIRGLIDARAAAAERAARQIAEWSPDAHSYADLGALLATESLDAVIDLTPAPAHADVNRACLDAGLHVYSEKPIASSVADADALVALASERR